MASRKFQTWTQERLIYHLEFSRQATNKKTVECMSKIRYIFVFSMDVHHNMPPLRKRANTIYGEFFQQKFQYENFIRKILIFSIFLLKTWF